MATQRDVDRLPRLSSDGFNMSSMANAFNEAAREVHPQQTQPTMLLRPPQDEQAILISQRRRSGSRVRQARYDVADEDPPLDHFHEPSLQQALVKALSAMSNLKDVLASGSLHMEL
ncbi:MAG: hypothetical protein ACRERD_16665, partial [Candidatus Binatia bacterium]